MLRSCAILLAVAAAGLIAGSAPGAFLAAALAAASAAWLKRGLLASAPTLYANLDPQTPDSAILLTALKEAIAVVSRTRNPLRLRLTAFTLPHHPEFRLDLNSQNDPELVCGHRKTALGRSGVWLADHPLPLVLPRSHSLTLRLTPSGRTRVRVAPDESTPFRRASWLVLSLLVIAACLLDADWLLAATLGFAFQSGLLENQAQRTPKYQRIQSRRTVA